VIGGRLTGLKTKVGKELMKFHRILCSLILLLFSVSVAGGQSLAYRRWKPFWDQFSAAVKTKNKAAVERLMTSEKDFFSGGGGESRDEWLRLLDQNNAWGEIQRSVAMGVVPRNEVGRFEISVHRRQVAFRRSVGD
jgi:hypothetical protein